MRNLAVIPARSGSKGLIDKNIRLLRGMPLMAYSIQAAQESGIFEEIMVSTDSEKYAEVAMAYGASVPFLRSQELSGDWAGSWDVIKEVVANYKSGGREFDTVCLLQPTSPLRTSEDIIKGYEMLDKKGADAITSVCKTSHSPLWSMLLPDDLSLKEFRKQLKDIPRQKLKKYYQINGALYIRKVIYTDGEIKILIDEEYAYIMDRKRSVDIDTIEDFTYAEFLVGGITSKGAGHCASFGRCA